MAKNINNVEKLLNDLTLKITEQGSGEMDKLIEYKRNKTHNKSARFEAWDTAFYMSRYD
jgi:Zn-dependent oligopeptidase